MENTIVLNQFSIAETEEIIERVVLNQVDVIIGNIASHAEIEDVELAELKIRRLQHQLSDWRTSKRHNILS